MSGPVVTQADRVDKAHRWMGQLPRDQFDLLLILTNEATERGRHQSTAPLIAAMEAAAGMFAYIEEVCEDEHCVRKARTALTQLTAQIEAARKGEG